MDASLRMLERDAHSDPLAKARLAALEHRSHKHKIDGRLVVLGAVFEADQVPFLHRSGGQTRSVVLADFCTLCQERLPRPGPWTSKETQAALSRTNCLAGRHYGGRRGYRGGPPVDNGPWVTCSPGRACVDCGANLCERCRLAVPGGWREPMGPTCECSP